ncbi:MAG: ABC transporter permease [Ruminococcus sp.]|jgi:ABC-2 type transport system permease protein|nr:ABC transporter permease [Ruminococcus sp.]
MGAIYRREVKAYFTSPIAYVFITILFYFAAQVFVMQNIVSGVADVSAAYSGAFFILLFIIPLLTMRLFTEEKRQKTDQCLLTAPVSLFSIVGGKFLAACTVLLVGMSEFVVFAFIMNGLAGSLDWAVMIGNFLGFLLLGASFIAIGEFVSAMTENQVVAAIIAFIANYLLFQLDNFAASVSNEVISVILQNVGFYPKYNEFTAGILSLKSVVFFLSVVFIFNFLTVRALERRRWN